MSDNIDTRNRAEKNLFIYSTREGNMPCTQKEAMAHFVAKI